MFDQSLLFGLQQGLQRAAGSQSSFHIVSRMETVQVTILHVIRLETFQGLVDLTPGVVSCLGARLGRDDGLLSLSFQGQPYLYLCISVSPGHIKIVHPQFQGAPHQIYGIVRTGRSQLSAAQANGGNF